MINVMLKGSESPLPILQIVGGTSSEIYFLRKFIKHLSHDFVAVRCKLVSGEYVYFYTLQHTVQRGVDREVLTLVQQSGLVTSIGEVCGDSMLLHKDVRTAVEVLYMYNYIMLLSLVYNLIVSCYIKQTGIVLYYLSVKCQR